MCLRMEWPVKQTNMCTLCMIYCVTYLLNGCEPPILGFNINGVFKLDAVHIWANRVRVNIIMTESRTRSTYKLRSHLPLCILSLSCLSWPAQTGCWLHYRMLSKKHNFITSNLLFKSVFLWMNAGTLFHISLALFWHGFVYLQQSDMDL